MNVLPRVALAALLSLGVAAPLAPLALAQEGQKDVDASEAEAALRKAADQLEQKDWDGALATYAALEKAVAGSKLTAAQKAETLQLCHYNSACCWSLKGEKQKALDAFEKALEAGFYDFDHIAEDGDLDPLREEPRFKELVKKHEAIAKEKEAEVLGRKKQAFVDGMSKQALFPFDFDLEGLDGKPLRLSELKGKVVLVDFWGTWCPPCRMAVPHLVELHEKLSAKGFAVVGLNWERGKPAGQAKAEIKEFSEEAKIPYRCALIPERAFLEKYDIEAFPTAFLIDKAGRVRLRHTGYEEGDGALFEAAVEKLLAEPAAAAGEEKKPEEKKPPGKKGGAQEF